MTNTELEAALKSFQNVLRGRLVLETKELGGVNALAPGGGGGQEPLREGGLRGRKEGPGERDKGT